MEVTVNKEIRNYTGYVFRIVVKTILFSILACIVAVGFYFILKYYFGIETLSWMCILGSTPFVALELITWY